MNELQIEAAVPADVGALAALEKACFSVPWSARSLLEEIENPNSVFLVFRENGAAAAYINAAFAADECYIGNIAVREDLRRRRIGSALLGAMIGAAKQRGAAFLSLEVRASNAPARRLYERAGFVPVGERKNYYKAPVENAVIYTLTFLPPEDSEKNG